MPTNNGKVSVQPRFDAKQTSEVSSYLWTFWERYAAEDVIPSWGNPGRVDALRAFAREEPILAGALSSMVSKAVSLDWQITGGRNKVARYQEILAEAEAGAGWSFFLDRWLQDYWQADQGGFVELGRKGKRGPVVALYNLDAGACQLLADIETPLAYYPRLPSGVVGGKRIPMEPSDFARIVDMPSPDESKAGLGFCATSRALKVAKVLLALYNYEEERLADMPLPGIAAITGMTQAEVKAAFDLYKAHRESREQTTFKGVLWLAAQASPINPIAVNFTPFSGLPEGFDKRTTIELYVYTLALDFGVDVREFWPASQTGATKAEAEIQAQKAKGKGFGRALTSVERAINWDVLPEGLEFIFDQKDSEDDLLRETIREKVIANIAALAGGQLISAEEARRWLVELEMAPEWLAETGETTAHGNANAIEEDPEVVEQPDLQPQPTPAAVGQAVAEKAARARLEPGEDFVAVNAAGQVVTLWSARRVFAAAAKKYNPDQPRVPAGRPDGGQWVDEIGLLDQPSEPAFKRDEYGVVSIESAAVVMAHRIWNSSERPNRTHTWGELILNEGDPEDRFVIEGAGDTWAVIKRKPETEPDLFGSGGFTWSYHKSEALAKRARRKAVAETRHHLATLLSSFVPSDVYFTDRDAVTDMALSILFKKKRFGVEKEWNEADHPRHPAGDPRGGQFAPKDEAGAASDAAEESDEERLLRKLKPKVLIALARDAYGYDRSSFLDADGLETLLDQEPEHHLNRMGLTADDLVLMFGMEDYNAQIFVKQPSAYSTVVQVTWFDRGYVVGVQTVSFDVNDDWEEPDWAEDETTEDAEARTPEWWEEIRMPGESEPPSAQKPEPAAEPWPENEYIDIHADLLQLSHRYQNQGVTEGLIERQFALAVEKRFGRVFTTADITIGKYAWATKGFDYADEGDVYRVSRNFKRWCQEREIELDEWPEFESAEDVARFKVEGVKIPYYEIENRDAKAEDYDLGKAYMLDDNGHGDWEAVRDLTGLWGMYEPLDDSAPEPSRRQTYYERMLQIGQTEIEFPAARESGSSWARDARRWHEARRP